jgi:hypothetical protein
MTLDSNLTSKQYGPDDEGTHVPATDDADWQESVFVHWYDSNAGIGGVTRIGHEPNRAGGGRSALHCFVATADGIRFRRNDFALQLEEATRPRSFRAGGSSWHVDSGQPTLEIHEPGLDVDLTMEHFYPLTDFFPPTGSMVEDFAKDHYETSGRIRGTARIGGRALDVDGLYHRDHSWGIRKTMTLKSHRWISGTFGPDLSFGSICWHSADDALVKVGYLVRDGELLYAQDVDVITYLDVDGLTHRGGEVAWSMPDGSGLRLHARPFDAVVAQLHNVYYIDRAGMCDFEISNNARLGDSPVSLAINAAFGEGLSYRSVEVDHNGAD